MIAQTNRAGAGSRLPGAVSIQLALTETGSSLDSSLFLLYQFLRERLIVGHSLERLRSEGALLVDLKLLGACDDGRTPLTAPAWREAVTCPIRLYRSQVVLGPLYVPGEPALPCPHCLDRRWLANRPVGEQLAWMYAPNALMIGQNPRITPFALETIWLLLVELLQKRVLLSRDMREGAAFYVVNLDTQHVARHYLLQDARCPVCDPLRPDTPEEATIELSARPKHAVDDYRQCEATDYRLPFSAYINPIAGMLGPEAVPNPVNLLVPVGGTFSARYAIGVQEAWWRGHGSSVQQSLALGILEGLERYAGHIAHGKRTVVFASYEKLGADALDPRSCGLYQPAFYEKNAPFYQPFTPQRELPWVWGYSFRKRRPLLVPEQMVYYQEHRAGYASFIQGCSSGCAIGSSREEALFYALLELIERDAFLLTWYARLAPPRIDPHSCRHQPTLFLLDHFEKHGYELLLFDTRLDIRIPTVTGVARLKKPGPGNIMLTAGCALEPEEAIHKTVSEIAAHIIGFRQIVEHQEARIHAMVQDFSLAKGLAEYGLLFGLPEMAPHMNFLFQNSLVRTLDETYQDWQEQRPRHLDLRDDVLYCIDTLLGLGLDVIAVEQTCLEQERVGLTTMCAIVPGLLPIDFGWGRDRVFDLPRLRTVPRTAGYRTSDFVPDTQDVIPHPFP